MRKSLAILAAQCRPCVDRMGAALAGRSRLRRIECHRRHSRCATLGCSHSGLDESESILSMLAVRCFGTQCFMTAQLAPPTRHASC